MVERLLVDLASYGGMLQNRFNLGGENETPILVIKVERFDADAIAGQEELFAFRIPNGYRIITFDLIE